MSYASVPMDDETFKDFMLNLINETMSDSEVHVYLAMSHGFDLEEYAINCAEGTDLT